MGSIYSAADMKVNEEILSVFLRCQEKEKCPILLVIFIIELVVLAIVIRKGKTLKGCKRTDKTDIFLDNMIIYREPPIESIHKFIRVRELNNISDTRAIHTS